MAVAVADGESALLRLRPSDGMIVLNANTTSAAPCEIVSSGTTISITAYGGTATVGRTVILDYGSGLFLQSATGTSNIVIDMTVASNGSNDALKVRGSSGNDAFIFGAGGASGYALNINGGSLTGQDSFADVSFKQVEKVIITGADGNDIISGAGGFGTGTVYPTALRLFGGAGDDTITGGTGADTIRGGIGNDTMDGALGNDTILMNGAGDGTDIVNCTGTPTGTDTVDYSARTGNLVLRLDGTATSGEGSENDTLSDKIVNVIGGAGNDTITIGSSSTVSHVVTGGAGDDIFTGSPVAFDTFDGEAGDDTCVGVNTSITYANRATAVTVTICDPSGDCSASANDGDQTATTTRKSGTVATASDDGMTTNGIVTIAGLSGITAADIGRKIKLTGFMVSANNDGTTGYPITARTATSTTINVSANTSFDETSLAPTSVPAGLTWSIVGIEKDNVTCANVTGSAQADTITGDGRANTIHGGSGNDTLVGGAGDDTLYGEAGDDLMWGGIGTDHLIGGIGNDTMDGGDGDDQLQGDAGNDIFTCDGPNVPGGANGTAPGDADFTVDLGAGDTGNADCVLM